MTWRVNTARGWVVGSKSQQAWEQQVEGTATLPDAETMFRETLPCHCSWEDAGLLEKILLRLSGWLRMAVAQYPCSSLGYQPLRLAELCSLGLQEELFTWRNLDKKTVTKPSTWRHCEACVAAMHPLSLPLAQLSILQKHQWRKCQRCGRLGAKEVPSCKSLAGCHAAEEGTPLQSWLSRGFYCQTWCQ